MPGPPAAPPGPGGIPIAGDHAGIAARSHVSTARLEHGMGAMTRGFARLHHADGSTSAPSAGKEIRQSAAATASSRGASPVNDCSSPQSVLASERQGRFIVVETSHGKVAGQAPVWTPAAFAETTADARRVSRKMTVDSGGELRTVWLSFTVAVGWNRPRCIIGINENGRLSFVGIIRFLLQTTTKEFATRFRGAIQEVHERGGGGLLVAIELVISDEAHHGSVSIVRRTGVGSLPPRLGRTRFGRDPQRSSQTWSMGCMAPHTVSGGSMTVRCDTVT